jgi:hypothetical protein
LAVLPVPGFESRVDARVSSVELQPTNVAIKSARLVKRSTDAVLRHDARME